MAANGAGAYSRWGLLLYLGADLGVAGCALEEGDHVLVRLAHLVERGDVVRELRQPDQRVGDGGGGEVVGRRLLRAFQPGG